MKAIMRIWLMLMFVANPLFAQQNGVDVTGKVIEKGTRLPVEQASVRLLNAKDSAMVRGMASNANGSFSLKNVRPGSYILNITYIGFEPIYRNIAVDGKKNPLAIGTLEMDDSVCRIELHVRLGFNCLVRGRAAVGIVIVAAPCLCPFGFAFVLHVLDRD